MLSQHLKCFVKIFKMLSQNLKMLVQHLKTLCQHLKMLSQHNQIWGDILKCCVNISDVEYTFYNDSKQHFLISTQHYFEMKYENTKAIS